MIASKSKKKLLIYSISIPTSIAVITGVTVGGYFISSKSNPFLNYAKGPINNTIEAFQAVYYSYLINNAHLMVLPGFTLTESMSVSLLEPKYNDAAFLLVDDRYGGPATSQVAGASFRSDQGSFVTGVAIAMYLNENKDYFITSENDKLTWGTYGGMPFNSVLSFMTGVQLGIAWFNTEIAAKNANYEPIYQISLGNAERDIFSGGFGTNDGDYIIERFLLTDIDCLMPVAGPQTLTAINKILAKNKRTVVIGVDSPIENDKVVMTKKLPKSNNMPKIDLIAPFSSLKNTGLITYNILENMAAGNSYDKTITNNNIGGLGYQSLGTIDNDCVGVSDNGKEYFINAMKIAFPNDNISDYKTATNKLNTVDLYQKLNTDNYRTFVTFDNEYCDISKYEQAVKNVKDYQKYPALPEAGEVLAKMPDKVPNDLTNNFSQAEWDYKKSAPERVKKYLDPKENKFFQDEIKVVLSTPSSVLLDASFGQSCYDGIAAFYKNNDVILPFTNSTQALINAINNENSKKRNIKI